jgi:hypothetical protein
MAGAILVSDDFWLVGARFARYIDTELKPDGGEVENLKPEPVDLDNLRPLAGIAELEAMAGNYRPQSTVAQSLRPRASATNLRPQPRKVEEI